MSTAEYEVEVNVEYLREISQDPGLVAEIRSELEGAALFGSPTAKLALRAFNDALSLVHAEENQE